MAPRTGRPKRQSPAGTLPKACSPTLCSSLRATSHLNYGRRNAWSRLPRARWLPSAPSSPCRSIGTDAYGLARRAELRAYLRSRPEEERRRIVADPASVDPELRLAIIEMPPELSGTYPSDHRRLTDVALRTVHGDERFTEIAELEEAIPILETVLEAGKEEVAREAGVDLSKFDDVARPYVQDIGALWLRKFVEGDRRGHQSIHARCVRALSDVPASNARADRGWRVLCRRRVAPRQRTLPTQQEKANGAAA